MTIENLKQIAIKYATTKGSRVPLAPDELCNAVVQYFNEFLKITADINTIQVAVTEEGENIVFTITGNTLDGKAFTPIVITVDHNDFVTDQEFEEFKTTTNAAIQKNTESINSLSFRVGDTENDITTIQVQVGQINTRVGNTETNVTNLKNRVNNTETNIAKINSTLNNKLDKITSPISNFVLYANIEGNDTQIRYASGPATNSILYRDETGKTAVVKGVSGQDVANMENLSDITAKIPDVNGLATKDELQNVQNSLNNKRSVISSPASSYVVYTQANGLESNLPYSELANQTSTNIMARRANGTSDVKKGISGENVANMENIADLEEKIPDTSNLATKTELQEVESKIPDTTNFADVTKANTFADVNHFTQYITSFGVEIGSGNADDDEYDVSIQESGIEIFHYISGSKANSLRITENKIMTVVYPSNEYNIFNFPNKSGTLALTSDIPAIPEYTSVDSVIYDTTNGAIIAYDGAHEIHIPLQAGENVTIDASEDNKKIVISAAGGGGTGDVTAAGNNTFTGVNTFNNSIYAKNGVVAENTTNYGANSVRKGPNTYSFPNKSGTFAMTTDIIKNPIYFISFYINAPDETLHLTGTMMSKNSYETGQKTNEEFAVMLADNLYINNAEGLAVSGKLVGLTETDIVCIYSDDGLAVRYLDEKNSDFELPTAVFFVMETEL